MLCPEKATSGSYLDSAHGNNQGSDTGYGVKRNATGFPSDYARGNCAHCHEQHASIGGAEPAPTGGPSKYELLADNFSGETTNPYAQSDDVCFYCHVDSVTGTYQNPAFSNYTYSATFGGCPTTTGNCTIGTIFEAFNSTSYHNLNDVLSFAISSWSSTFTADSNPCSACHNVHKAKRSCGKPSGSYNDSYSAISKPSDHNNLWGDSTGEKMSDYTGSYQAPYWYGSTTYFEPYSANTTQNGSNLPDYVTFCQDCHSSSMTSYGLSNTPIDWTSTGDKHGNRAGSATLASPYSSGNYVLSCTDCHEPHGTPNTYLIRKEVNNGVVTITGGDMQAAGTEWASLCERCHTGIAALHHVDPLVTDYCGTCHSVHGAMFETCIVCHYHGSTFTGSGYTNYPIF